MSKQDLIRKLTSRKFLVTLISVISGVITLCIGESEIVEVIAGAAMTVVPAVVYCFMEGKVDAESAKTIAQGVKNAATDLGAPEKAIDTIDRIGALGEAILGEEITFDLDDGEEVRGDDAGGA